MVTRSIDHNTQQVASNRLGQQLSNHRQLNPINHVPALFQRLDKGFDGGSSGDGHQRRLLRGIRVRNTLNGPNHLGGRHRREPLELKLNHPGQLARSTGRELDCPQKHRLGRHPGDIQTGTEQESPITRHDMDRQRLVGGDLPLASRRGTALVDRKLVKVSVAHLERQHIAGMRNGCRLAHAGTPP